MIKVSRKCHVTARDCILLPQLIIEVCEPQVINPTFCVYDLFLEAKNFSYYNYTCTITSQFPIFLALCT